MSGIVFLYVAVIVVATGFAKLATTVKWNKKALGGGCSINGTPNLNLLFVCLSFLTLFLFTALSTSGADYIAYSWWYDESVELTYKEIFDLEWAYFLFNRIVRRCTPSFMAFNAIYSLVTLSFVYAAIYQLRDKVDFTWAVFIYAALFYLPMFNTKRICLAAALLFYAVACLFRKRYIQYGLVNILASGIHTSAILWLSFLIVYAFMTEKLFKRYIYWIVIAFILLSGLLVITKDIWLKIPLSERYEGYQAEFNGIGFGIIAKYGVLFFIFLRWLHVTGTHSLFKKDLREECLQRIILVSTGISMCFAFAGYVNQVFSRMQTYSMYSFVLFLPYLIKTWNERKYNTLAWDNTRTREEISISKALIVAYVLFFFMDFVNASLVTSGLDTYVTIWGWTIGG